MDSIGDHRKDSFSDRFCDDLTEVIISYLSIEDKLKLEFVSKQFQRLIFNKQNVLNINFWNVSDKNNSVSIMKLIDKTQDFQYLFDINCNLLTKILFKFKFINEINFTQPSDEFFIIQIRNISEVFYQISDYCKQLKSLSLPFNCPTIESTEYFGQSLGHQLIKLRFGSENRMKVKRLMRFCPNLLQLTDINIGDLIQNQEIQAKQLKSLNSLHIYDFVKDFPLFKIFVTHFSEKLIDLDIDLILDSAEEEIQIIKLLDQFRCLKTLKISSNCDENYSQLLPKAIKSMANNCKQLNCFEFNTIFRDSFDSKTFCQSFSEFNGLKRFSFGYFKNETGDFDFNCLKNCKQLTHLKLGLMKINSQCFKDFDLLFPNLKSLILKNENKLSDETMDTIKKIKSLTDIQLMNRNNLKTN